MQIDAQPERLKPVTEKLRRRLCAELCYHHAAHIQPYPAESVDKTQDVEVIGYAEVAAHLVLRYIRRAYHYHYFGSIAQLHQHTHLAVRRKPRQHAGSVVIVKQFAAEFQIQLTAEAFDTLLYLFGLYSYILVVVKACQLHRLIPRNIRTPSSLPDIIYLCAKIVNKTRKIRQDNAVALQ